MKTYSYAIASQLISPNKGTLTYPDQQKALRTHHTAFRTTKKIIPKQLTIEELQ